MRKIILTLLAGALLFPGTVPAQQGTQFAPGQIYGNDTAAQRNGRAASVSAILDRALGSTRGSIIERGASGWVRIGPSATAGLAWISGGTGADPAYGILGMSGGGCGVALTASNGGILYSTAANCAILPGNITTTKQYLSQTGNGSVSAPPAWATIAGGDITGAAMTSANDTNVTLTLGGTPATSLLRAASLTLGWTGTLAAARLNANVVQAITNDTNVTGSIATQNLTLGWTGTLAVGRGGLGIGSGTSGGIPYFSSGSTIASSTALLANRLVLGGGAGVAPSTLGSLGTTTTVLHGNAAGAPTFGAVALGTDVSGQLPIGNGGTGQATQQAALNALMPSPTRAGDVVYYNGTNWVALAGNNSGTQFLSQNSSGVPSWAAAGGTGTVTSVGSGGGLTGGPITTTGSLSLRGPTVQVFTSGSGTYTTPAGVGYLRVTVVGGGGGGGGSGTGGTGGAAGTGGTSTFASATITATGGTGGDDTGAGFGGGIGTGGNINIRGSSSVAGSTTSSATSFMGGGQGGSSTLANTGQGGAGAAFNGTVGTSGSGGGGGGTAISYINTPTTSYSYAVGAGGTVGAAGTSGAAGAVGVVGIVIVEEF